jgi:hypothetical protein
MSLELRERRLFHWAGAVMALAAVLVGCAGHPPEPAGADADGAGSSSAGGTSGGRDGADTGGTAADASAGSPDVASDRPGGGAPDAGPADARPADAEITVDGGPLWSGPSMPITVTVNRGSTMGHLPAGFAGFSYEKSHLTDAFFTADNAPLVALFRLLGPGVLRIGGNAVDRTTWKPDATPVGPGKIAAAVGTVEVDALAAFLAATGWQALYGVDMKISTPAAAVAEATYATQKLGDRLYGLEIGNEISNYGSYATNRPKWDSFAKAIHAALPAAQLTGPGCYGNVNGWAVPFARDEVAELVQLTQHFYLGSGRSGDATMAKLLGSHDTLVSLLKTLQTAATDNHLRASYRLSEANSFFNHGTPGVSNTLGAALWSIDLLLTSAQYGAAGVNFHGGGPGQDGPTGFTYTPIDELQSRVTGVRPLFYGMLLVSLAGPGDLLATTIDAGRLDASAYAVARTDGTSVVLLNKEAGTALQATVDLGAPVNQASARYLLGPKLEAQAGLTLAGAEITPAGVWMPGPAFALAAGSKLTVTVPAASAVLLRVR